MDGEDVRAMPTPDIQPRRFISGQPP
jgi:hypothetical protein